MALSAFTGTITHTALNANFTDALAAIDSQASDGQKNHYIVFRVPALAVATAEALRIFDFRCPDDLELEMYGVMVEASSAGYVATMTLTCPADNDWMAGQTITKSATSTAGGEVQSRTELAAATSTGKMYLKKGIVYRLALSITGGTSLAASAFIVARGDRRKR